MLGEENMAVFTARLQPHKRDVCIEKRREGNTGQNQRWLSVDGTAMREYLFSIFPI